MWKGFAKYLVDRTIDLGIIGAHEPVGETASTQSLNNQRMVAHTRALQVKSLLDNLGLALISTVGVASIATWALWAYINHKSLLIWQCDYSIVDTCRGNLRRMHDGLMII
jgi:hypothetical protein